MAKAERPDAREPGARERMGEILAVIRRRGIVSGITPEKLRLALEDLGPTFIKLGQIMSMRPDMLPADYCQELSLLRAEVKPMDFRLVLSVIEEEYGRPWDQVFLRIEPEPLGSASIAQAHRALLKDGSDVVVKIQRPGIYAKMAQDVKLLTRACGLISIIGHAGRVLDFKSIVAEMWAAAREEMDFLQEAENMRRFAELNAGVRYVGFPKVFWELTTSKVLVMEHIDGIRVDDVAALENEGYDLKDLGQKLAANYVKQILEDGFFQADPHPGNIRIRGGQIVWIDLGMTGRLSAHDRRLFKNALAAAAENDIYALKSAVLAIGRHTGKINHSRLYSDIEETLAKYGSMELGSVNIGQLVYELIRIADYNGIALPAGVAMLGRGVLTIEGVLAKIDPEISLLGVVASNITAAPLDISDGAARIWAGRTVLGMARRAIEMPTHATDLIKMAAKGHAKLNVELIGSEEPLARIGRMVDRLILCILNAAILIGSSLICTTDMTPKLLGIPLFGILGYAASFSLSVWLLWGMIRGKRY